jgi:hypothetical protein
VHRLLILKRKDNLRALRWVRDRKGKAKTEVSEIELEGKKQKVRIPVLEMFSPVNATEVEAGAAKEVLRSVLLQDLPLPRPGLRSN